MSSNGALNGKDEFHNVAVSDNLDWSEISYLGSEKYMEDFSMQESHFLTETAISAE